MIYGWYHVQEDSTKQLDTLMQTSSLTWAFDFVRIFGLTVCDSFNYRNPEHQYVICSELEDMTRISGEIIPNIMYPSL